MQLIKKKKTSLSHGEKCNRTYWMWISSKIAFQRKILGGWLNNHDPATHCYGKKRPTVSWTALGGVSVGQEKRYFFLFSTDEVTSEMLRTQIYWKKSYREPKNLGTGPEKSEVLSREGLEGQVGKVINLYKYLIEEYEKENQTHLYIAQW